jgi:TetR/AcrR family transcriptional repressor of nem operon
MSSRPPFGSATRPEPRASTRSVHKAQTHARIVASAVRLFRQAGLGAASVPQVMGGAGLTPGGFYAHFRSKRAMDAQVLAQAMREVREEWLLGLDQTPGLDFLARAVKRYLSPSHRDNIEGGCVLPSTVSELTRADRITRAAMAEGVEEVLQTFAAHAPPSGNVTPRERALAALALCIGGITMARALRGHPLSDELLRACVKWALPEPSAQASRKNPTP